MCFKFLRIRKETRKKKSLRKFRSLILPNIMLHYMPVILETGGLIAKSLFFRVLSVAIERRELVSSLHLWGILNSDNLSPPEYLE